LIDAANLLAGRGKKEKDRSNEMRTGFVVKLPKKGSPQIILSPLLIKPVNVNVYRLFLFIG